MHSQVTQLNIKNSQIIHTVNDRRTKVFLPPVVSRSYHTCENLESVSWYPGRSMFVAVLISF